MNTFIGRLRADAGAIISKAVASAERYRNQLLLALAAVLVIGTATAAEAPEIKRRLNNGERVRKMHPYMQRKVGAILTDLESHGEKPVIDPAVVRNAAQQAALVKKGNSKVSYSFHNAGLAADVYDNYTGQAKTGSDFWLKLASSARSHKLQTGIVWGLSVANRNKITALINAKKWDTPYQRGWDPAHVEPPPETITLSEAKRGLRPPIKGRKS